MLFITHMTTILYSIYIQHEDISTILLRRLLAGNTPVLAEFISAGLDEKHLNLIKLMIQPNKGQKLPAPWKHREFLCEVHDIVHVYNQLTLILHARGVHGLERYIYVYYILYDNVQSVDGTGVIYTVFVAPTNPFLTARYARAIGDKVACSKSQQEGGIELATPCTQAAWER